MKYCTGHELEHLLQDIKYAVHWAYITDYIPSFRYHHCKRYVEENHVDAYCTNLFQNVFLFLLEKYDGTLPQGDTNSHYHDNESGMAQEEYREGAVSVEEKVEEYKGEAVSEQVEQEEYREVTVLEQEAEYMLEETVWNECLQYNILERYFVYQ